MELNMQNQMDVIADELRQIVERYERLDAERVDVVESQKEVMAEAKGQGFDTKAIRKIVALRKKRADQIAEEEAIESLYRQALGMS